MIALLAQLLDGLGIVAFAVTGALVASRRQMDIAGFALLAVVTGVGGGTLRDLLLGIAPVGWLVAPLPLALSVAVALIAFFTAHIPSSRLTVVLWLDAVGLAVFAVSGATTALDAGAGAFVAIVMGVITATFGGIIRDVLGGEVPVVLQREIYVTAALLGAAAFVLLEALGCPRDLASLVGFGLAFALRGLALRRDWSLPRYRSRAPAGATAPTAPPAAPATAPPAKGSTSR